jgi:hypothetical protein
MCKVDIFVYPRCKCISLTASPDRCAEFFLTDLRRCPGEGYRLTKSFHKGFVVSICPNHRDLGDQTRAKWGDFDFDELKALRARYAEPPPDSGDAEVGNIGDTLAAL